MSRRHSYSEVVQASEKRRNNEKRFLREKLFYRWGILVFVGVFSFLYWFVLIPLVAPILPANWTLIGPVAFFIWLIIIFPFLWLWYYKQKSLVSLPPPVEEDIVCPPYPITVTTIQPSYEANSASIAQENCVWIPVQPGNATPSLYNAQTGRDSFQSGYQLDEIPEKSAAQEGISRNNSAVQLSKKSFNEAKQTNSHRLISVSSSSSTEIDGLDFKLIQRNHSDSLHSGEQSKHGKKINGSGESLLEKEEEVGEEEEPKEVERKQEESEEQLNENVLDSVDQNVSCDPAVELADKAPLEREQSFKGLPEMQNFGEYLHLVTVDTPLSPRDAFFSDLGLTEPLNTAVTSRQNRKSYHPGGDLSEIQRRIAEVRKSLPPLFHYPDLEMGETSSLRTSTLPQPAVFRLENEQKEQNENLLPQRNCWSVSAMPQRQLRSSGEFFVADASRLNSITSEMQIVIDSTKKTSHLSRWEAVVRSDRPSTASSSDKMGVEELLEGRFVILSKDYASNNLEAFIRCEQDAMSRERSEGIFISDDLEDSVFLEVEH